MLIWLLYILEETNKNDVGKLFFKLNIICNEMVIWNAMPCRVTYMPGPYIILRTFILPMWSNESKNMNKQMHAIVTLMFQMAVQYYHEHLFIHFNRSSTYI